MRITSPKNPLLQDLRKAARSGRPMAEGGIVLEGPHLLEEALRGKWGLMRVIASGSAVEKHAELLRRAQVATLEVSERVMETIVVTEDSQGIVAVAQPREWTPEDLTHGGQPLVVVLDRIQDPGNAGTIMRSAEAFGATGVIFVRGSVRVANGKFLRASAGSVFRLPFLENVASDEAIGLIRRKGLRTFVLAADGAVGLAQADLGHPCALVVGNEGAGVSDAFLSSGLGLHVPSAKVESLNAAVACSIALFEAARQRGSV